jgi:predicted nucleotidyltransferase/DNA-binding XRE family transcriptional regulator
MKKINQIKKLREIFDLTQLELASLLGIPLKSIQNWEQGQRIPSPWVIDLIYDRALINKQNKVLTYLEIKKAVKEVASKHDIKRVYLFGSYAKGLATPNSDIDLYMETNIKDMTHFGIAEEFRQRLLDKKVELFSPYTIIKNSKIDLEIKQTGILIFEKK